jgi:peroxiredoxin
VSAWFTRKGPLSAILSASLAAVVAAAIVIAGLYLRAPRATRVHVGDTAPDFELPYVEGGAAARLSAHRGAATLLVFFDTRWPQSDWYLKSLERMHRRYSRRGLRTMAVAVDPDPAVVREFVRRNEVTFAVVSDPGAARIGPLYGTPRDPEAYLLDPSGRVEAVFVERVDDASPRVRDILAKYLRPIPPRS